MPNNTRSVHLIDLIQLKLGVFMTIEGDFSFLKKEFRAKDSYTGEGYLRLIEHVTEEKLLGSGVYDKALHDRVAPFARATVLEQHKWLADLQIDRAEFLREEKINGMNFLAWLEKMALERGEWYEVTSKPLPAHVKYPNNFIENTDSFGPDLCMN